LVAEALGESRRLTFAGFMLEEFDEATQRLLPGLRLLVLRGGSPEALLALSSRDILLRLMVVAFFIANL
jgi:hypothetical protein